MGIEDWSGDKDIGLYDRPRAIARIEAAVEAARALDHPFVITGRTEVLLYGLDGGMDEILTRLQGFAEAGAHCLFAPGTWDLQSIRTVTEEAGGPGNILVPLSEVNPHGPVGVIRKPPRAAAVDARRNTPQTTIPAAWSTRDTTSRAAGRTQSYPGRKRERRRERKRERVVARSG